MAPLSSLGGGEVGVVQGLNGGRGFISRAVALGFAPGTRVEMVQNFRRSPLIVLVRDTYIALGRGEAGKIVIRRLVDS